jgi:hypothetical protein
MGMLRWLIASFLIRAALSLVDREAIQDVVRHCLSMHFTDEPRPGAVKMRRVRKHRSRDGGYRYKVEPVMAGALSDRSIPMSGPIRAMVGVCILGILCLIAYAILWLLTVFIKFLLFVLAVLVGVIVVHRMVYSLKPAEPEGLRQAEDGAYMDFIRSAPSLTRLKQRSLDRRS